MDTSKDQVIWAELHRADVTLLVSETAWLSVLIELGARVPDRPFFHEGEGRIMMSESQAEAAAALAEQLSVGEFTRTLKDFIDGPISGTMAAPAIRREDAEEARQELIEFLRLGAFAWRFIAL